MWSCWQVFGVWRCCAALPVCQSLSTTLCSWHSILLVCLSFWKWVSGGFLCLHLWFNISKDGRFIELSYLVTVNLLFIIYLCIIFLQVLFSPSGTINCPYKQCVIISIVSSLQQCHFIPSVIQSSWSWSLIVSGMIVSEEYSKSDVIFWECTVAATWSYRLQLWCNGWR
jgi:hypothetical protein